jgi:ribosomal protein S12 methylthiotransferase accessory factor
MFAGIAAGPSRQFAEISALEELIERDAVHIWWHGRLPAKAIQLAPSSHVAKRMETLPKDWRYSLFSIPSPSGVPVIGCLLLHKKDQLLSLGIASRLNAETAAMKAIAEAVQLHEYARGLTDESGTIWSAVRDRIITGQNLKPVRADRAYLDSYRSDFRDVVDLPCQMQVYLDPRAHSFVEDYWEPKESIALDTLTIAYANSEEQHHKLLSLVATQASEIVSVDVTTSEIKEIGLRVVRVLAPGLYGNSPTAFPYFGGSRLAKAMRNHYGQDFDWQESLRLEPPPYA